MRSKDWTGITGVSHSAYCNCKWKKDRGLIQKGQQNIEFICYHIPQPQKASHLLVWSTIWASVFLYSQHLQLQGHSLPNANFLCANSKTYIRQLAEVTTHKRKSQNNGMHQFCWALGVSKIAESMKKENHIRINQSIFHSKQCADRRHESERKMSWKQDLCSLSPTLFWQVYEIFNQRNWRRISFIKLVLHSTCFKRYLIWRINLFTILSLMFKTPESSAAM